MHSAIPYFVILIYNVYIVYSKWLFIHVYFAFWMHFWVSEIHFQNHTLNPVPVYHKHIRLSHII